MLENLNFVKELGRQSQRALEGNNLREFARLMDVHWRRKKERSAIMSNEFINDSYDVALANGALGGKLIGAGGGGFLMRSLGTSTKWCFKVSATTPIFRLLRLIHLAVRSFSALPFCSFFLDTAENIK